MTETTAPAAPAEQEAAPRLSVIGTGYLGATHAACMAELGFEVLGVDVDPAKIERLARGEVPFHEPGLPELLRTHVASGRLRFTTDVAEAARWADVHFIGVGTPQKVGETAADLSYVDAAVASLAAAIDRDALIVGKSTVPVGTARRLAELVRTVRAECMATIGAVSNPDNGNQTLAKAGRNRWLGKRPHVRGVAMNPVDHPHGGGEGRTSGGRHPVTPWGKPTKGARTRHNKATDKFIIRSRHAKKKG